MAWTASGHAYVGPARRSASRRRFVASGSAHVGIAHQIPVRRSYAPTRRFVAQGSASVGTAPRVSQVQIARNQAIARERTRAHYRFLRQRAQSQRWRAHGTAHVGVSRGSKDWQARGTAYTGRGMSLEAQHAMGEDPRPTLLSTLAGVGRKIRYAAGQEISRSAIGQGLAAAAANEVWQHSGLRGQMPQLVFHQGGLGPFLPKNAYAYETSPAKNFGFGVGKPEIHWQANQIRSLLGHGWGGVFDKILGPTQGTNFARRALLHEMAHSRQRGSGNYQVQTPAGRIIHADPHAVKEGGAEAWSADVAPTVYRDLGWEYQPYVRDQREDYKHYEDWFRNTYGTAGVYGQFNRTPPSPRPQRGATYVRWPLGNFGGPPPRPRRFRPGESRG